MSAVEELQHIYTSELYYYYYRIMTLPLFKAIWDTFLQSYTLVLQSSFTGLLHQTVRLHNFDHVTKVEFSSGYLCDATSQQKPSQGTIHNQKEVNS